MKHVKTTTNESSDKNPVPPLLVLIALLVALLIVTTVGWTRSASHKNGTATLKDSLSVCENTSSLDSQTACFERLSELSKLLSEYSPKS
jgi:hypothetical protein